MKFSIGKTFGYCAIKNRKNDGYEYIDQVDIKNAKVPAGHTLCIGRVAGGANLVNSVIDGTITYVMSSNDKDEMVIGFENCIIGESAQIFAYADLNKESMNCNYFKFLNGFQNRPIISMRIYDYMEMSNNDLGFAYELRQRWAMKKDFMSIFKFENEWARFQMAQADLKELEA